VTAAAPIKLKKQPFLCQSHGDRTNSKSDQTNAEGGPIPAPVKHQHRKPPLQKYKLTNGVSGRSPDSVNDIQEPQ